MEAAQMQRIIDATQQYMQEHGISQSDMAIKAGMNPAYLSHMLQGKTKVGETMINNQYWLKVANTIGLAIEARHWQLIMTPQFKRMVAALETARTRHVAKTIIGAPGSGKTMTIKAYHEKNPKHTYVITIHDLLTVSDVINELMRLSGIPVTGSRAMRLANLIMRFRDIKLKGGSAMIIFDEAENMKAHTMKLLKGLFDGLNRYCSIVLVGTDQLLRKMQNAKLKDKEAGPQFYRRFTPGYVRLPDMDSGFEWFFSALNIKDAGLKRLLCELCDNYGELNTWLEPVINEAIATGETVTEEMFRIYHDMPKIRRA